MILVTGGMGFIGANFIRAWLAASNEPVLNLDSLTYAANPANLADLAADAPHVFVQGDINDAVLLGRLLERYQPRAVLHFAAETHVDRSIVGPAAFVRTNIDGTFALLEAVRHWFDGLPAPRKLAFRFVQVSTDEVYGSLAPDDAPSSERAPCLPNSPYAASKAAADHLVRATGRTYGLPVLITRCSNNYGPRQFAEKLIPLVITRALSGLPLPVFGDGLQVRDWLHVDDHQRALCAVLENGRVGEVYNIGGNCPWRNIDLVLALCGLLDELVPESAFAPHRQLITHVADRPGHDRRYALDAEKIRHELGWLPRQDFQAGLRSTVLWYLSQHAAPVASGDAAPAPRGP